MSEDMHRAIQETRLPIVILTEPLDIMWHENKTGKDLEELLLATEFLYEKISQNGLAIVNVEDSADFMYLANMTKYHLRKLHNVNILWNMPNATWSELYDFSQLCWNYGFTNVLFYSNGSKFTYTRFPFLKVEKLMALTEYYDRKEIHNFHGYPLTFPITSSPPRCYRFIDHNGNHIYVGYMYKILMIFIEQFNFTFREYPHNYDDDDKDPLMESLQNGYMDFTSFPVYPNKTHDASDVLWNANVYILVPKSQPIAKYKYFYKPFGKFVWLLHILVIVGATSAVAFITLTKYSIWDFSKSFIYICSIALYQYQLTVPVRSLRFNLLYILLIVYNFIMINYYLCMLSSLLVITLYEPQIDTIPDLTTTSLRLKITQNDVDYYKHLPDTSPIVVSLFTVEDGIVLDNL
ncbi:uncharacterized protein LOC133332937 [Musca vetustissima]|uniref:uncharacterized protein LOC133332937 n=1 Tax=Musca vetustissima TaxID=27455 RepID=UPI002AB711BF|nr:uncharacterized protein LOC133332937 [Musca vetustissima]